MLSDDEDLLVDHTPAPAGATGVRNIPAQADERQRLLAGSDEDEDFFLTGPRVGAALASNESAPGDLKLAGLQQQVSGQSVNEYYYISMD